MKIFNRMHASSSMRFYKSLFAKRLLDLPGRFTYLVIFQINLVIFRIIVIFVIFKIHLLKIHRIAQI